MAIPTTANTKQYQQDAKLITAATAFPAAGADANCTTIDIGAGPYRQGDYVMLFKYTSIPALVATKIVTVKVQDCDTTGGSFADVGCNGTIVGAQGNGTGGVGGQLAFKLPPSCRQFVQVNVAVPADAGTITASTYTFGPAFWA